MTSGLSARWLAGSAMVAVAAAGCSVSVSVNQSPPTPSGTRITTGPAQATLGSVLLTSADLALIPGMPSDMAPVEVDRAQFYENPDPRGPCGAKVYQPKLSGAAVALFRTQAEPAMSITEAVWDLPTGLAERAVTEVRRDVRTGCPSFNSDTPFGSPQENQFLGEVALPALGDQAVATATRIDRLQGPGAYGAIALIQLGDRLVVVATVAAQTRPSSALVADLATRAADKARTA